MSGRVVAVLAAIFMGGVLLFNQLVRPAPGTAGAWLFDGASRPLVITCALIFLGECVLLGLFIGYQHLADHFWPDRHYQRAMRSLAAANAANPQRPIDRPRRTALPPTAPLPQAPTGEPTVTNEQGAHST
jgi:hypothetical protein